MAKDNEQGVIDEVEEKVTNGNGGNGGGNPILSALKSKELILPAVLSAAGAVAAAKGPDLVRKLSESTEQKSQEKAEELGKSAMSGVKESLGPVGKLLPGGGGGGGGGGKKTRRLPIQRWTDVAVPIDKAYEAWLEFDKFPKFMHRVLSVEKKGDTRVSWQEKIWFSKRQWEGRITERRKNDRIVWKTTNGTNHHGVVSFHKLDSKLTRVMVDMEFEPTGMMEKMASGLRFAKRAVQADLARFKAYVEFEDAKGLEYKQGEQKDEDEQKDEAKDPKSQKSDASGSNGSGKDDGGDDDDREADREQREQAREERRRERAESK